MAKRKKTDDEPLREDAVFELAQEKVFARGADLFEEGDALMGLHRQGASLRGWCWGTASRPYTLHAVFKNAAITQTNCDCPYSYGGICKHLVALLLAACHTPEAFQELPPLEEILAGHSRESLVEILSTAIDRDPQLLAALAPEHFTMPDEYFEQRDEW